MSWSTAWRCFWCSISPIRVSPWARKKQRSARIANPVYDHGFAADFDGYDVWGELRYRLITDSLGFKDAAVREVPLKSDSRRILLIGNSFTEGIGMSFEELVRRPCSIAPDSSAARKSSSSTPASHPIPRASTTRRSSICSISGLQFDEVVLFSDTSDVTDEATSYFCIDDDPKYRAHCTSAEGSTQPAAAAPKKTDFLIDRFVVTNRVRIYVKRSIQSLLGNRRRAINTDHARIGWAIPGLDVEGDTISRLASRRHREIAAEHAGAVRSAVSPEYSPDHRGLSLGAADRAGRS